MLSATSNMGETKLVDVSTYHRWYALKLQGMYLTTREIQFYFGVLGLSTLASTI